jgi:hypothetical protein
MNAKQNPWQQGLHIFVIELDFFFLVNCFFLLLSELLDELSSGLFFFHIPSASSAVGRF